MSASFPGKAVAPQENIIFLGKILLRWWSAQGKPTDVDRGQGDILRYRIREPKRCGIISFHEDVILVCRTKIAEAELIEQTARNNETLGEHKVLEPVRICDWETRDAGTRCGHASRSTAGRNGQALESIIKNVTGR